MRILPPTAYASALAVAVVWMGLGVPAIVGTGNAMESITDGQMLTLSCAEGDEGHVYDGTLEYETEDIDLQALPPTGTSILVNVASPAAAFKWWRLPAAGVGLARMEFIINNLVRIHPMALLHPERVVDQDEAALIRQLTGGYKDPQE